MEFKATRTTYEKTGFYSKIIVDYIKGEGGLRPFYNHPVSIQGIRSAIAERKKYATNRKLLVERLRKNYEGIPVSEKVKTNIDLLLSEDTFTITTAHQPNIFTGHLYFIYKILHAIKLADFLKKEISEYNFIPVFYLGSEDADLEELGHVVINGTKHEWKTGQSGAVGRMKVDKALIGVLDEIAGEITIDPFGSEVINLMKECYAVGTSIGQATRKLVNALFGEYGLIVLEPDDPELKKAFIPVAEMELKSGFSHPLVEQTVGAFPKEYKVQASGREINLFYLRDDIRERIEKGNGLYSVLNTACSFTGQEMITELKNHPDRFSPNVILRPVFQEMILPNIAFIGGGGEVAYWLELKRIFEAVHVPFPVLVLRNSFMVIARKHGELAIKLGLGVQELLKPEQELLNELVKRDSKLQLNLENEKQAMRSFYEKLKITAGAVDSTLARHTEALNKRAMDKVEALEKKMLRAEKKKFEAQHRQLAKLKNQLFPNGILQERTENFMPFYALWGREFIAAVHENSLALEQEFVIVENLQ